MPTFTGVCNWGELSARLAEHAAEAAVGLLALPVYVLTGQEVFSTDNGSDPYKAFDGDSATGWMSTQTGTYWVEMRFPVPQTVYGIELLMKNAVSSEWFEVHVSIDGTTFTKVLSGAQGSSYGTTIPVCYLLATPVSGVVAIRVVALSVAPSTVGVRTSRPLVAPIAGNTSLQMYVATVFDGTSLSAICKPYSIENSTYPVQYLWKVEEAYAILAVQGIYQVDATARTHIAYIGRLGTPTNAPPAYAAATTLGTANLTATLSDNRRASVQSTYNVYPHSAFISPDIQNRFALVPIYVYRSDENWRGWFKDLYVAQIPPQTMLNGETVTAQDGSKYTFFNIPPSGDGFYNNFLASGDTNKWLVIKH